MRNSVIAISYLLVMMMMANVSLAYNNLTQKIVPVNFVSRDSKQICISKDKSTIVMSDYTNDGKIWIYNFDGTSWRHVNEIGGPTGSNFGASLSLSSNGQTLAVGAPFVDSNVGSTFVFVKSGASYILQAKLVGTGYDSKPLQGKSVSLSADGNTLAIGSINDVLSKQWIFVRSGASWTQQALLIDQVVNGAGGHSISLSADGNTVAVGAPFDDKSVGAGGTGAVFIYTRSGSSWSRQADLHPDVLSIFFGASVSLSSDGNTLAVGATGENKNIGSVWIYTRSGSTWSLTKKWVATFQYNSFVGTSVTVSSDGKIVSFGGKGYNTNAGAAWIIRNTIYGWSSTKSVRSEPGTVYYGQSVSSSSDGLTLAVASNNGFYVYSYMCNNDGDLYDDNKSKLPCCNGATLGKYTVSGSAVIDFFSCPASSSGWKF